MRAPSIHFSANMWISFIVIFCNAIQNYDDTDLNSLQAFVESLESCRTISEGADKLYKMCHLFLRISKLYLQAKMGDISTKSQAYQTNDPSYYTTQDGTQIDLSSMSSFDPYLSALGLMPNSAWPSTSFAGLSDGLNPYLQGDGQDMGGNPFPGMGQAGGNQNSVQDWFSGSRYLMNMMEAGDDSQMLDFEL
jgi:hypothetical protein